MNWHAKIELGMISLGFFRVYFLWKTKLPPHPQKKHSVPAAWLRAFKSLIANPLANWSASITAERAARDLAAVACFWPVLQVPQHLHIKPSSTRTSAGSKVRKERSYGKADLI